VRLVPGAVVTGSVYDERGEPIQSALVDARQIRVRDGHPVVGAASGGITDDRGRYRLFGLGTGRWIVSARTEGIQKDAQTSPRPSFYYPGTADVRFAVPLDLVEGRVSEAIDIQRTRFEGVTISGTAIGADGQPLPDGFVTLDLSYRSGALQTRFIPDRIANGRFEFSLVPPGDYVVQVARNTGRTYEFGREFVTVADAAPSPLIIRTTEGHSVEGNVTIEGNQRPAVPLSITLVAANRDDAPMSALMAAERVTAAGAGKWRANHVVGTQRFALMDAPPGWFLKSVRIGGRETVDEPFEFGFSNEPIRDVEIVVSPSGGSITGTGRARPATGLGYTSVIFSTSSNAWYSDSARVRFARSTRDGRFNVTGLPPGAYYVAAIPPLENIVDWQDFVSLDTLIGIAERVTVEEGQTRDVTVASP
jgi:hypothetical protein